MGFNNKVHIAIFVKNLSSGGAEKQSVLLAKALSNDYEVHYLIFNGDKIHRKYLDMLAENEAIKIVSFKGGLLKRFRHFVIYLKQYHIQFLFSYLTAANVYACCAKLFCKIKVYTGLRNAYLPYIKHFADMMMTNCFADGTVVNCFSGKDYFCAHGFNSKRLIVIPNCFEHIDSYNEKIPSKCPHIVTVGRFVAQKDYETAIRTIASIKSTGRNVYFDIVGYGYLETDVRRWVKQYEIEDITSIYINPNNIAELLTKADIYLSTSLFEGTSNSIMEAMNADLPIVCTNVGDNAYLVKEEQNGLLVDVKDVNRLTDALCKLLDDAELRKNMGMFSKKHLTDNYSMETLGNAYMNIIENNK